MFEMWGGVSGGQAGAAAPDGGSGPQGWGQAGEETVNRVNVKVNVSGTLLRSVSTGSQSFEGFPQRGKEVQR